MTLQTTKAVEVLGLMGLTFGLVLVAVALLAYWFFGRD